MRSRTCDSDTGEDPPETAPAAMSSSPDRPTATFVVNASNRESMRALDGDMAVVSPLIDGRLKDISEGKR